MDGSGWLMPNPDGQHLPTGITAADVAVAVLVACTFRCDYLEDSWISIVLTYRMERLFGWIEKEEKSLDAGRDGREEGYLLATCSPW